MRRLGDLHATLGVTLQDMVALVEETLRKSPYSKAEVCETLDVTEDELNTTSLSERTVDGKKNFRFSVLEVSVPLIRESTSNSLLRYSVEFFKLHDRAKHVYGEAARVLDFKRVCEEGGDGSLEKLGKLMDASHDSCSALYECSCEELDSLVELCK